MSKNMQNLNGKSLRAANLPLNIFAYNRYSQNGEDGIIAEIFSRLNLKSMSKINLVEFGAWDGKHLSNTFALVEKGANSLYIESNIERYKDLVETKKQFKNIKIINAEVNSIANDEFSLTEILKRANLPKDFDLLSIDIDSWDLDIWESLERFQPKVVVIEINSSILPGIYSRHSRSMPSNSFSATIQVAAAKKYSLVCHTGNLIFVTNKLVPNVKIPADFLNYPEKLFLYDSIWMLDNDLGRRFHDRILRRIIRIFTNLYSGIFK